MRLAEEVDKFAFTIDEVLRGHRYHKAADIVQMAFQDIKRSDLEVPQLRRRIKELEAELATLKPAQPTVEREEYGTHIKWTGD
jgi:hypothetical protein